MWWYTNLMLLLPVLFLLHDFEEAIVLPSWMKRNRAELERNVPIFKNRFLKRLFSVTTERFMLMVTEEFLIFTGITLYAYFYHAYYLWFAAFAAFSLHLIVHFIQALVLRRYVPSLITSLISLPYCIYMFVRTSQLELFTVKQMVIYAAAGFAVGLVNLLLIHIIFSGKSEDAR